MSFIDKLGKTFNNVTTTVSEKTKNSAEILRLNNRVSEQNRTIKSLEQAIGKKYRECYGDAPAPEFADMIASILTAEQDIASCQERLRQCKGYILCENCGAEIPIGLPFCDKCGTKNPEAEKVAQQHQKSASTICARCGTAMERDTQFCTCCGAPRPAAPSQPVTAPNKNVCTKCGAVLQADMKFCTTCGTPVTVAAPESSAMPKPNMQICPTCQAELSADVKFCTRCGTKLNATASEPTAPIVPPVSVAEEVSSGTPLEEVSAPAEIVAEEVSNSTPLEEVSAPAEIVAEEVSNSTPMEETSVSPMESVTEIPAVPETAATEKICSGCGASMPASMNFCTKCGTKLDGASPVAKTATEQICSSCGASMPMHIQFCTKCGTRMQG